jgi:hypothetical protein
LSFLYRYELRRPEEIVATGHLTLDTPLKVGDCVAIGESRGIVVAKEPLLGEPELRLVVELHHEAG